MNKSSGKQLRIALFYDWLNQWGGAEKVLLDLIKLYPDAPVYTLVYDLRKTSWLPKNIKIIPSFINKLPFAKSNPIYYTPLYPLALEQFDFSKFDIVISTTSTVGHCLLTPPQILFVCYFHNINRYLYQTPSQFSFLNPILKNYQSTDKIFAQRPDFLFCNSKTVQKRIKDAYSRDAKVINPGIDTDFFVPSNDKNPESNFFLIVSRLVPHKNIEIAIKACIKAKVDLKIVGTGRLESHLRSKYSKYSNIEFLGQVDDLKLLKLYQNCLALIHPQNEDFGLAAIEAQSCGKPVIALNSGGATETIINQKTGMLFNKLDPQMLTNFPSKSFNPNDCVQNAAKYSSKSFMLNFSQALNLLWQRYHQTHITS